MGDYPLPRKLVLTTLTDEARPQSSVVYTWNLAPSYNDATFAFIAPPDAKRIVLAEATVASAEKRCQEPLMYRWPAFPPFPTTLSAVKPPGSGHLGVSRRVAAGAGVEAGRNPQCRA